MNELDTLEDLMKKIYGIKGITKLMKWCDNDALEDEDVINIAYAIDSITDDMVKIIEERKKKCD